jgi:flavin reductase (DIM6/NTAB) family NADH-FMN oxidoreductase RutF
MTQETYKKICSRFPKGVAVVTARHPDHEEPVGVTVSTFTGVSLNPPSVLVCLCDSARTTAMVLQASWFAINFLTETQSHISQRFARCDWRARFCGVSWLKGPFDVPLLCGTAGHFICERRDAIREGDHYVVFGRVLEGACDENSHPLVYWASGYGSLANPCGSSTGS